MLAGVWVDRLSSICVVYFCVCVCVCVHSSACLSPAFTADQPELVLNLRSGSCSSRRVVKDLWTTQYSACYQQTKHNGQIVFVAGNRLRAIWGYCVSLCTFTPSPAVDFLSDLSPVFPPHRLGWLWSCSPPSSGWYLSPKHGPRSGISSPSHYRSADLKTQDAPSALFDRIKGATGRLEAGGSCFVLFCFLQSRL